MEFAQLVWWLTDLSVVFEDMEGFIYRFLFFFYVFYLQIQIFRNKKNVKEKGIIQPRQHSIKNNVMF